ncbi:MAG: hypothetical protein U0516_03720 [Candidatus Saccharibacteria bacterium]
MENFGKPRLPQSRTIHTAPVAKRRKFKFRWWMVLILVAVIAIIGLVVLRFSRASVIPPDELAKIDQGLIIKKTLPCSVEYPPYSYKRTFSVQECIDALKPEGYAKLVDMVTADLEAIYVKNHSTPTPTPAPTPTTTATSTTNTSSSQTSTTPSTSSTATTTANTGQTTSTSTGSSENQSTSSDASTGGSPIPSDPDSQIIVKDLGTLSGFVKIDFTPQNPSSVTAIAVFVGNTNVGEDIHSPYKFGFDTSQFKNGDYKISTVVLHKDNTTTQQNYTTKIQNSSIDRFFYSLGAPWRFIFR